MRPEKWEPCFKITLFTSQIKLNTNWPTLTFYLYSLHLPPLIFKRMSKHFHNSTQNNVAIAFHNFLCKAYLVSDICRRENMTFMS